MADQKLNPEAFIGIGVCFMGAGIAITAALRDSVVGAGMGLFGLGVVFLILGITKRKQAKARESGGDDGRPPA